MCNQVLISFAVIKKKIPLELSILGILSIKLICEQGIRPGTGVNKISLLK